MNQLKSAAPVFLSALLVALGAESASGQQAPASQDSAYISIDSRPPGQMVYLDGRPIGTTPLLYFAVAADSHEVVIKKGGQVSWFSADYVKKIYVARGDTLQIVANLLHVYFIRTEPANALVMLGDSLLGRTPIALDFSAEMSPTVLIKKEGYKDIQLTLRPESEQFREFVLEIDPVYWQALKATTARSLARKTRHRRLAYWGGAVSLATGIGAVFFKNKANSVYNDYHNTADPARMRSLLRTTKRYDTLSGVSFGLFQLSFAASIYYFLKSQ